MRGKTSFFAKLCLNLEFPFNLFLPIKFPSLFPPAASVTSFCNPLFYILLSHIYLVYRSKQNAKELITQLSPPTACTRPRANKESNLLKWKLFQCSFRSQTVTEFALICSIIKQRNVGWTSCWRKTVKLTVFVHAHRHAFLESAGLALIPMRLVNNASSRSSLTS